MLRKKIESWIDLRISKKLKNSSREVRGFLKNHERKNVFIENMLKEIKQAEGRTGLILNIEKIKKMTFEMTDIFMKIAINTKLSEVRTKNFIKKERDDFDKTEKEIKEEFEEMGVIEVERSYKSD
jgi:hypothetical protein